MVMLNAGESIPWVQPQWGKLLSLQGQHQHQHFVAYGDDDNNNNK